MTEKENPMDILRREYPKARKEAKKEIFRLQLLAEYLVDSEKETYEAYKEGRIIYDVQSEKGLDLIAKKKAEGVRMINLLVVDNPLSTYTNYAIEMFYIIAFDKGKETLLAERQKVNNLVTGQIDYWLFDNSMALPMLYDKKGHIMGAMQPVTEKSVEKYVELKDKLLRKATPLPKFLRNNNLKLINKKSKNKSF